MEYCLKFCKILLEQILKFLNPYTHATNRAIYFLTKKKTDLFLIDRIHFRIDRRMEEDSSTPLDACRH